MKKILAVLLTMVFLASIFAIPASAYSSRTNTYYPMQQVTYGYLGLTTNTLQGLTYCELNRAGKIVKINFTILTASGPASYVGSVGGNYDTNYYEATDNYSSNYADFEPLVLDSSALYKYAETYHKVKISSYVHWDNAVCEGNNNGRDIPAILIEYN